MSTMRALQWAFDIKGVDPLTKLSAIYFAGHAGTFGGTMQMDFSIVDAAAWCGCTKEDLDVALTPLRRFGLKREEIGPWRFRVTLQMTTEGPG